MKSKSDRDFKELEKELEQSADTRPDTTDPRLSDVAETDVSYRGNPDLTAKGRPGNQTGTGSRGLT
ncbi:MAG: hypothetical protein ACP5D7_01070 [Limnospira sp.]